MNDNAKVDLLAFDPHWCVFWGEAVTAFHLDIWAPYLRRSRHRFAIMAGEDGFSAAVRQQIAELPNCRIVEPYAAMKPTLHRCPSLSGFLYVGSRRENFKVVNSFERKLHVFIGHGESDKVYSGSRTASIYDSVLVSRYRVVDRFPRSIRRWVRAGALAIGSPIAEGTVKDPWRHPRKVRTILYAPTWEGHGPRGDYTSLPEVGPALVAALPALSERGITVIVRPHPVTGMRLPQLRDVRDAIYEAGAARGRTKAEDFADADVMLSDISGVTAEFLFTEKPTIVPITRALTAVGVDEARLAAEYPWAYRWDVENEGLLDWLDRLESSDPLRSARATAARAMYRGHRSLEEAVATFDLALSCVRWRRSRIPPRYVFEARRRATVLRPPGRRAAPGSPAGS